MLVYVYVSFFVFYKVSVLYSFVVFDNASVFSSVVYICICLLCGVLIG